MAVLTAARPSRYDTGSLLDSLSAPDPRALEDAPLEGPGGFPAAEGPEARGESAGILMLDERLPGEGTAVTCVNRILASAIREHASDIHIEAHREAVVVRYRIDGVMFDRASLRAELAGPVLSRIKIISQLNIAERRLPQDGRFTVCTGGLEFDVRVSVAPGVRGEKAVLRLLAKNKRPPTLEELGLDGANQECVAAMVQRPHGMVLVTGPTGSGKTTTLYASLGRINMIGKNTMTIEDPVEYELPRATQIQVHPKIGLTFASGLRSLLRQDPDVVMVGEIRDAETLGIAIQAALTGHLVLSTLHCNDAAGAAARCIDMGTEPFLFTSATTAIVAQRLIRKVCARCREARRLTEAAAGALGLQEGQEYWAGRGCPACHETGYRGRTAVFEVLRMTEEVKRAIHRKEASSTLRRIAIGEGMQPLRADAIRKLLAGITTPEEVLAAVHTDA